MKKLISALLAVVCITAIAVTPTLKVTSPSFSVGSSISSNKNSAGSIGLQ